jgi:signal transduction histidine kinase
MQERAKVIGGTLGVHPGAAGGTVVTVRAPLRGGELA